MNLREKQLSPPLCTARPPFLKKRVSYYILSILGTLPIKIIHPTSSRGEREGVGGALKFTSGHESSFSSLPSSTGVIDGFHNFVLIHIGVTRAVLALRLP
jgi:hypothetical protein